MSFLRSFWRQKKSRQTELTEVQFTINGTTLAVSGVDKNFVKSVEALGTGEYLITLVEEAFHDLHPHFLNVNGQGTAHVVAVTKNTVTVNTLDLSDVAADLDFSLGLIWLYTNFIR